jgi:hypothetical protein
MGKSPRRDLPCLEFVMSVWFITGASRGFGLALTASA